MTEEALTDAAVRRLILGDIGDEERERLEKLFISDPEARERILIAEDELIEEYLEDSLSAPDREKFLANFQASPQQRRKLRIATSIKELAVAESVVPAASVAAKATTSGSSSWRSFFDALWLWKRVTVPVAAALIIAAVFGAIWYSELSSKRAEEKRRQAIEKELVELNSPPNAGTLPPPAVTMVLPPLSVRSVAPPSELKPTETAGFVELRLVWIQNRQYPRYVAVLRQVGGTEQFAIANLSSERNADGNVVRLRIPIHLLTRGLYQVRLDGVTVDGKPELNEEYTFTVGR